MTAKDRAAAKSKGGRKLTHKREAFARAVVSGMTQADAYRSAFSTSKMKAETVQECASRLMADHKVYARVQELNEKAASAAVMTRQEALERLSNYARTDLTDLVDFVSREESQDGDGNPVMQGAWRIKDSVMQDPAKLAAISELTAGRDGVKIKTHSPLSAIQQLAKMQGWEAATKHELTGKDGSPIQTINATMTPQEAAEAYAGTINRNKG